MKTNHRKYDYNRQAFTRTELFFVLAGLFVIGLLVIARLGGVSNKAVRINCVNSLRQVGLAFRIWSGDQNDRFPMAMLTNHQGGPLYANTDAMFRYFQVMSNELTTPMVLTCSADLRNPATNFGTGMSSRNISYFINLKADASIPDMFLCGDRSLDNGNLQSNGTMLLSSNQHVFWWPKPMHHGNGNIAVIDGSVMQLDDSRLPSAIARNGVGITYLVFP